MVITCIGLCDRGILTVSIICSASIFGILGASPFWRRCYEVRPVIDEVPLLKINNHYAVAAISTLVALSGQAVAQSLTIDPDGIGETNVTVGGAPLISFDQFVPNVLLRLGSSEPAGSLLINGPWAGEDFRMRIGFSSTLRLEGGVHLEDIVVTSVSNGGGTSTVPGRIELDNSSLSARWNLPYPSDINSLEYQLENNSHLTIDFAPDNITTGGWGIASFEIGLTDETIVVQRPRDLRVTRVPTGSTVSVYGVTHITRASGAEVAANGHNIIIDGGVWETNRISGETLGDPALAEGGIDFRSGTIRIRDRYSWGFDGIDGRAWDVWDTGRAFNQDAMNAMLAGVTPAAPTIIAGQTLQFASWYNPNWIGNPGGEDNGLKVYEQWANDTYIASTLEVRGGRLLLGPEGGWEANPSTPWVGYPGIPDFIMLQSGFIGDSAPYTGPNPSGPFILDGGQFDFTRLTFKDSLFNIGDPNYESPQFRAGSVRGRSLDFQLDFSNALIELGSAGNALNIQLIERFRVLAGNPVHFAAGATVSIQSLDMWTAGVIVGDGSSVTLDNLSVGYNYFSDDIQIGLNSDLVIGRLGRAPLSNGGTTTLDIGAGSVAEIGSYIAIDAVSPALASGPGTLRLMPDALEALATLRWAYTVGGNLELDAAGTLTFDIVTPVDATSYSVAGDFDFDGCGLSFTLGDELFTDNEQVLIDIGGTSAGTFAGIPEGTLIESRLGVDLYLSYTGGDGNDIVLTSVGACLADLNGDGNLNFFDVSAFLQAFGNNDPVADFTNDGQFNFFDVSAFLQAFAAGCP